MMLEKCKVFAYITRGDRLLVFAHTDFPEAGIQVPAGTVESGEATEFAVMREADEETGLTGLVLDGFLGDCKRRSDIGLDEVHHRFFYHLRCTAPAPERWQHAETHPHGLPGHPPIRFDFFWAHLDQLPPLIAGHDEMIDRLRAQLAL
jgi:8-oxo-dGTP pyrophosphatase MutT (NUDIX family)